MLSLAATEALETSAVFEKTVTTRTHLVCCAFWHVSPRPVQQKYKRYGLLRDIVDNEIAAYKERGSEDVLPFKAVISLVNHVTDILSLMPDGSYDTRTNGKLLARSSFASCSFGGPATDGDLEEYVRQIEESYDREVGEDLLSPTAMLRLYREGYPVYLRMFLYAMLGKSIDAMKSISETRDYTPGVLWERTEGSWRISPDVFSTQYHLLRSLTRFVDPVCGTA